MDAPDDATGGGSCDRSEPPCSWSVRQRVVRVVAFTTLMAPVLVGMSWFLGREGDDAPPIIFWVWNGSCAVAVVGFTVLFVLRPHLIHRFELWSTRVPTDDELPKNPYRGF